MSDEPSSEELRQLLSRVEVATEGDHDLDGQLTLALLGADRIIWRENGNIAYAMWPSAGSPVQPYTSSLDAAVALVRQVLPGWGYDLTYREAWGNHTAGIISNDRRARPQVSANASAPLALLGALLRTVQAESLRHNARDGSAHNTTEAGL